MENLTLASHRIAVQLPSEGLSQKGNPAILLNDGGLIEKHDLHTRKALLIGICPNNRLSEYTPWPSKAIRPGAPDFDGKLSQYTKTLTEEILPELIKRYALAPAKIAYGGHSLGGLASVMSLWETDAFAAVFSLCGSFWYPDVPEFIESHNPVNQPAKVFLLNGSLEGKDHHNRLENAPVYARRVHTALKEKCGAETVMDEFAHHDHQAERLETALRWAEQIL